jgi:signal transduction histidine kinase
LNAIVDSIELKGQSKNLALHTTYDTLLPEYVSTDSHHLQQVLYNLLGNAIKFSKEGGIVELQVLICPVNKCLMLTFDKMGRETENSSMAVHESPQQA